MSNMSICLFRINKTTCEKIGKTKQNEILCPHIFNHTNLAAVTLAYHIPMICLQGQLILVFTNAWLLHFICHDRLCAGRKEKKDPKCRTLNDGTGTQNTAFIAGKTS